jgi:hypothetical protein
MRKLSDNFINLLKSGFLAGIRRRVRKDKDLDLQIRDNYLNIYYKGNSLLKLAEVDGKKYRVEIHPKFLKNLTVPDFLMDEETTATFLGNIPHLKENIIKYGQASLEVEYEQLIVRANNLEPRNNSEYFIIDRQYATRKGRFDFTGLAWDRNKRRKKGQAVPLCFMEVKFALNPDIKDVDQQLNRYYQAIKADTANIAQEAQTIFRQKLELGLFNQAQNRLDFMKTLTFSGDIEAYQFVLVLVDYNPYSSQLKLEKLRNLSFASQIKIFHSGFAMWQRSLEEL